MVKNILCPSDFSAAAINGIEYAAKLAQFFRADLKIVRVQLVNPAIVIGSENGIQDEESSTLSLLEKTCIEVNKTYNVNCNYELETTNKKFESVLAEKSKKTDLIVMGTNGVDKISQYFFGTNSLHVVERTACNVLVVPEGNKFKTIKKIVFAWEYNPKSKFSISQLEYLIDQFDSEITILNVSKNMTQVSRTLFKALKEEVYSNLEEGYDMNFEQIFSDDPEKSISEYMKESDANLMAIMYYNGGSIINLFQEQIAKKLTEKTIYPLLIMHV